MEKYTQPLGNHSQPNHDNQRGHSKSTLNPYFEPVRSKKLMSKIWWQDFTFAFTRRGIIGTLSTHTTEAPFYMLGFRPCMSNRILDHIINLGQVKPDWVNKKILIFSSKFWYSCSRAVSPIPSHTTNVPVDDLSYRLWKKLKILCI